MKDECDIQSSPPSALGIRTKACFNHSPAMTDTILPGLERRVKRQLLDDVWFDPFTRGRYATDASHYQIMHIGVVAPRSVKEAQYALAIAREEGVSVLAHEDRALTKQEADGTAASSPTAERRVACYNLDALRPGRNEVNLAHILVGSEGTRAFSTRIALQLAPRLGRRAVGACHFGNFS